MKHAVRLIGLASEISAHRVVEGLSVRQLARRIRRSPQTVERITSGRETPDVETVERLVRAFKKTASPATRDRWLAVIGSIPDDLTAALLAAPERWDEVRAMLRERGDRG